MLQITLIQKNFDIYLKGLQKRGIADAEKKLKEVLEVNDKRIEIQQQLEKLQNQSNQIAKEIGVLMQSGKKEEAEILKEKTKKIKSESQTLNSQIAEILDNLNQLLYNIPNIPNEIVPEGRSAEQNLEVKKGGIIPKLHSTALPHWELIKKYDIIDFDLGNKVTGAGFPFYKKEGARMVRALVNYCLDKGINAGYQEIQPPVLVNETSGFATGQLPDKEGQMYGINGTNYYLIPTAEVPLTNIWRDEIVNHTDLPIKMMGYTPCFRREAGSWGANVRGLNRLHQFDKVEIVQIAHPDQSYRILDEMVAHVEKLIQSLELPYRILRLCGGDMGFTSALTYDFEVFSAAQEKWLEVSSVSNFETYQSNRLKLKFKDKDGKNEFPHTLNGSALAIPRILAALLENFQTENEIFIPKVLHTYTGFEKIGAR